MTAWTTRLKMADIMLEGKIYLQCLSSHGKMEVRILSICYDPLRPLFSKHKSPRLANRPCTHHRKYYLFAKQLCAQVGNSACGAKW